MGPGLLACPFFHQLLLPESTPTGTKSLTSAEEGGELALEAQRRAARAVEGGPEAFFFFLRFRSLIEATVAGALSRPRRSAARTPSRTLSLLTL